MEDPSNAGLAAMGRDVPQRAGLRQKRRGGLIARGVARKRHPYNHPSLDGPSADVLLLDHPDRCTRKHIHCLE